jgi:cytidyltransferase-like protein
MISIVAGEFQIIHQGHLSLFEEVMQCSDRLIVCLESKGIDPTTIQMKHKQLEEILDFLANTVFNSEKTYMVVDVIDFITKDIRNACHIINEPDVTYYTADEMLPDLVRKLEGIGFDIKTIPKKIFPYHLPWDYKPHMVSSATDIKAVHRIAGLPVDSNAYKQVSPWR